MGENEEPLGAAIVLDLGSGYTKVGFSGDEKPLDPFPSIAGSPKSSSFNIAKATGDGAAKEIEALVGNVAVEHYNSLFINRVVDRGVITNWEDGERLIDYAFQKLQCSIDDHPVLMTEPTLAAASTRERLVEIIFETFDAPQFYLLNQSPASLFSIGRTTGIVVASGEGTTTALPITEGFCSYHSLHRSEFAGIDITKFIKQVHNPHPRLEHAGSLNFYNYEKLKETQCFVSLNPTSEAAEAEGDGFELPDGSKIKLGEERFLAAEALFNPGYLLKEPVYSKFNTVIGHFSEISRLKPLAEAVCESIATSEEDYPIRQTFFENVMLTGGSTNIRGFKERFLQDMKDYAPSEFEVDVLENNAYGGEKVDADLSAWTGGSIMACLESTKEKFLTRAEYDEQGVDAVFHKISLFE